jgi:hypothetical protein
MDRVWMTSLKTISKKYHSMNRLSLVAHGVVLAVGVWLAVVAFIMRDIGHCLLFVTILSIGYSFTAFRLYRITHREEVSPTHNRESKIHLTGLAAIQFGEDGIKLTMPKRY